MTGNSSALKETDKILLMSISLPNGTNTMAFHRGTVTLGGRIKVSNVLYIPLQCNLISIIRLCKDSRCSVIFSDDTCVVQKHPLRTLIGAC